jgi:hypothetical protein
MTEQYVDSLIEAVLKSDTVVTARQKRLAWERLEQRAAQQTIWPPLVEPEISFATSLRLTLTRLRRGLAILLVDERNYERARKERLTFYLCPVSSHATSQIMIEFSPHTRPQV